MRDYGKLITELYHAGYLFRRGKRGFVGTKGLLIRSDEVVEFLRGDGCQNVYFSGMLRWNFMVPLWMVHQLGGHMWVAVKDEIFEVPDCGREIVDGAELLNMLRRWRGGGEHRNNYAMAVLCGVFPVA